MISHRHSVRNAAAFLLCGAAVLCATERQLSFDGIDSTYELSWDDARLPQAQMEALACFSPYVIVYCKPFLTGSETTRKDGKEIIDKVFMAPELDLCLEQPCPHPTGSPDAAVFESAARNLKEGDRQVELLRKEQVPRELRPVKAYLLASLEGSLLKEKAAWEYADTGKLNLARRILCDTCPCGTTEESLLSELANAQDGTNRLMLFRQKWQNKVIQCERSRRTTTYPIADWERFMKDFGITERRRAKRLD